MTFHLFNKDPVQNLPLTLPTEPYMVEANAGKASDNLPVYCKWRALMAKPLKLRLYPAPWPSEISPK